MERARYVFPIPYLILPVLRVLFGIPSSASRDAAVLLRGAHPAPIINNEQYVPPSGPFILAINHYDRPGLGTWWAVCALMCAVAARRAEEPKDIRFAMVREWWYADGFGRIIKQPLTRFAFGRLAKAYGMILLPPVVGSDELRGEGTLEVRRALALTKKSNPPLIGVAPEGRTGENLALCKPPHGTGRFLTLLARGRIPFLPAGIYENDDGILTVNFGMPFQLDVHGAGSRDQQDAQESTMIMVEVGKCLPKTMWGEYTAEIEQSLARTPVDSTVPQEPQI